MNPEYLKRGQDALREKRASGWKPEILDPVEKAKRNPGSLKLAIRAHCYLCEGGDSDPGVRYRVGTCALEDKCPLWRHRPWQRLSKDEALEGIDADAEGDASEEDEDVVGALVPVGGIAREAPQHV